MMVMAISLAGLTGGGAATAAEPGIPDGLLLPNEGEPSSAPGETTDWATDDATDRDWLLDPCTPTAYPTDRQRADFRTVSQLGPEYFGVRQLGVYRSPEVAAEVVAGFRRVLAACREGGAWRWTTRDDPTLGAEGLLISATSGMPDGARIAVTRVGAMVFLAYRYGELTDTSFDDQAAREVRAVAEEFLESV